LEGILHVSQDLVDLTEELAGIGEAQLDLGLSFDLEVAGEGHTLHLILVVDSTLLGVYRAQDWLVVDPQLN